MAHAEVNLAALIGSRICHDLISPIGAINNGLELLGMAGGSAGPEMDLIGDSVESASAKIRFFRIAYGAAGEQMIGLPEISGILNDLFAATRLDVQWHPQEAQKRADVRMAFLGLQCLEVALAYGGTMEVRRTPALWTLTGRGEKLNIDPGIWGALASAQVPPDLRPAHVQFGLLPAIARDEKRTVLSEISETEVSISF